MLIPGTTSTFAYVDYHHLSQGASLYLAPYLCATFDSIGLFNKHSRLPLPLSVPLERERNARTTIMEAAAGVDVPRKCLFPLGSCGIDRGG